MLAETTIRSFRGGEVIIGVNFTGERQQLISGKFIVDKFVDDIGWQATISQFGPKPCKFIRNHLHSLGVERRMSPRGCPDLNPLDVCGISCSGVLVSVQFNGIVIEPLRNQMSSNRSLYRSHEKEAPSLQWPHFLFSRKPLPNLILEEMMVISDVIICIIFLDNLDNIAMSQRCCF